MKFKGLFTLLISLAISGCSAFARTQPTALPTIVLDSEPTRQAAPPALGGEVTASGVVVPAQEAHMVFTLSGRVKEVYVTVGARVEAGQSLMQLEGQEELEVALSAAQVEVLQAQQALDDLKTQAETERIRAMQEIITYAQAVRDAQYALDNFTVPANQADLDAMEALNQMKSRLDEARAAFEPYKNKPSSDPIRRERKEAMDNAQSDYYAAVRRLQYEYELEVAKSQLARAQRDYETFKAGAEPSTVQLAEARLKNAQTRLAAAQAALENLTLKAPFPGTIVAINVHCGEWVIPGQPVVALADLDHLRVATTDLSERDLLKIAVGQSVTVWVKALQREVAGRVTEISLLADTLGGDVVYKTTIELEERPSDLRAGMSVDVRFATEQ